MLVLKEKGSHDLSERTQLWDFSLDLSSGVKTGNFISGLSQEAALEMSDAKDLK